MTMAGYRFLLRSCICLTFLLFIVIFLGFIVYSQPSYESQLEEAIREHLMADEDYYAQEEKSVHFPEEASDIPYPIILWWTPFTLEPGRSRTCGGVKCFFTNNRKYAKHQNMKVFLFYGTSFNHTDLPLPRRHHHEWALLHEEAPHNQYMFSHGDAMELFNHSCTFRRESHYPISTQWLRSISDIESRKYLVPTEEKTKLHRDGTLALMNYVQSDCGALSDRDRIVKMLQRHIAVDSYGKCLHNKDLPEHLQDPLKGMDHGDFYKLLGRYKFTLAMENGVCDDYMTEKFWRPFLVGSVPIILGSPKAKEFLPSNKSAILVSDYKTVDELVDHIKYLDANDHEYEKYLQHKHSGVENKMLIDLMKTRDWGMGEDLTKSHYIDGFECFVCRRLHENYERSRAKLSPLVHRVTEEHYGCPRPRRISDLPPGNLERVDDSHWAAAWLTGKHMAHALKDFVAENKPGYTQEEFFDRVIKYYTGS